MLLSLPTSTILTTTIMAMSIFGNLIVMSPLPSPPPPCFLSQTHEEEFGLWVEAQGALGGTMHWGEDVVWDQVHDFGTAEGERKEAAAQPMATIE
mmetsp:Transcript_47521/g.100948  ORF Transcript_47521/g.100948 Transcript_47521/m.100948 type:complete len:95 (+) Transcript_47521:234-518(+)